MVFFGISSTLIDAHTLPGKLVDGWMGGWVGLRNGWMGGWVDGWMGGFKFVRGGRGSR